VVQRSVQPLRPVSLAAGNIRHEHVSWGSIRHRLTESALDPAIREHALRIFALLAEAEAAVHGVEPDAVEFHEVGAWDSLADVVGAAALLHSLGVTAWSASPVPLGGGRVRTAHGIMPLPAPATARLLAGMPTLDDGVGGERVTPTGAALLRYLCPPPWARRSAAGADADACLRTLRASGTGFGSRVLPGLSNHVRALCFEPARPALQSPAQARGFSREIEVLEFEVDDQSGEDLATGLERLRAHEAVLDVTQTPVFGKKGRMLAHVRVLARGGSLAPSVDACFRETTTIGLRHRTVRGIGLERRMETVVVDGWPMRVKVVDRPGGSTAKAEADDAAAESCHARRAALRARAEQASLEGGGA
jgi:uncharacterized protein (TIGR00299 family) protein